MDYSELKKDRLEFRECYRDAEEELPHKMPRPRGEAIVTTAFLDASHAINKVTRRSHSGHTIFVNSGFNKAIKCNHDIIVCKTLK